MRSSKFNNNINSKSPRRRGMLTAIIRHTLFMALKGIRSLATPKGILAIIPIFISVIAYAKASYQPTTARLIISQPVEARLELETTDSDTHSALFAIPPFEAFLTNDGTEPIFMYELSMNLVSKVDEGYFEQNCNYFHAKNMEDLSQKFIKPMRLDVSMLDKSYNYNLKSGVVILPNTVLPLKLRPTESDPEKDAKMAEALGATRILDTLSHAMEIHEVKNPNLALCIAGRAFSAGVPELNFKWDSLNNNKVFTQANNEISAAIPQVPGRKKNPETRVITYGIAGDPLSSGIELFIIKRFSFF